MSSIKHKLVKFLEKNKNYITQDGTLNTYKLIQDIESINKPLMEYILSATDPQIVNLCFSKIKDYHVLNQYVLIKILTSKEYVKNSMTFYQNRIGLALSSNGNDIVLNFPFKDCVLVGGMDSEDDKNRTEVFFHELLDSDKIDQLLSPKVFNNVKRFGASKDLNLIIKGNNLIGLYTLLPKYRNTVSVISIDPPYYFQDPKASDSFAYNSNFKLSSWLTFMKNRIEVAHKLLNDSGTLYISTHEQGSDYLSVLVAEIFGKENSLGCFAWKKKDGGGNNSKTFALEHERVLVFVKDVTQAEVFNEGFSDEYLTRYSEKDDKGYFYWDTFKRNTTGNIYEITLPNGKILKESWLRSKDRFDQEIKSGEVAILDKKGSGEYNVYFKQRMAEDKVKVARSIILGYPTQMGTEDLKELGFNSENFIYPKPVSLIEYLIKIRTSNSKSGIIMDFFAGSGTLGHAVLRLNKEDGGNRNFILLEQMDYVKELTVERISRAIKKYGYAPEFTYCELLTDPMKDKIKKVKKTDELLKLVEAHFHEGYFQYVDSKEALLAELNKVSKIEEIKKLLLEQYFDHNREYISYSDIKTVKLDKESLEFNKKFYGDKKDE
jgi:adenine-specific DNA-methyltransferase